MRLMAAWRRSLRRRATAVVLTVMLSSTAWAQADDIEKLLQLNAQVLDLYRKGRYTEAVSVARNHLKLSEALYGPSNPMTANSVATLGELLRVNGAWAEAESLGLRAMDINEKVLGADHPQTAFSAHNLAAVYVSTRAFAKAEPLMRRALDIRRKTLGPTHVETLQSANNLAVLYFSMGAYLKAEPMLRQVLAARQQQFGADHPMVAESLNNLSEWMTATGAYAQAVPLMKQALAINQKVLGPDHPATALNTSNLANAQAQMGHYDDAEALMRRALAARESRLGAEHPDTAQSLHDLGMLYTEMDRYAQADETLQRALSLRMRLFGDQDGRTAETMAGVAKLRLLTGRFDEAGSLLKRAVQALERAPGGNSIELMTTLNNLAEQARATGDYGAAENYLKRALKMSEGLLGTEHPDTAQVVGNLAVFYVSTGDYASAQPLLQRTVRIVEASLGDRHPRLAGAYANLAAIHRESGDLAMAEKLALRAVEIEERAVGPDHAVVAAMLSTLAQTYMKAGAYARAEPLYRRALAIREQRLGSPNLLTAEAATSLGLARLLQGDLAQSEQLLLRAQAMMEGMVEPEHVSYTTCLDNLALLSWMQGNWQLAFEQLRRATRLSDARTRRTLALGDEIRKQAYADMLQAETSAVVAFSLAPGNKLPEAAALGLEVVLRRKGLVLDVMGRTLETLRSGALPGDQGGFQRWRALSEQHAVLQSRGPGSGPPEAYRAEMARLADAIDGLTTELASRNAQLRAQTAAVEWPAVQAKLAKDTVLVEWFRYQPLGPGAKADQGLRWGQPRYAAFVLRAEGAPVAVDIGEAAGIDLAIADLLVAMEQQHDTAAEIGRELHMRLVEPLRSRMGGARRLLISPDGQLNLLPFAALVDPQGKALLESLEISYLSTGRDLLRLGDTTPSRSGMAVFAHPDYGPPPGAGPGLSALVARDPRVPARGFRPLPGTVQEAKALETLFGLSARQVRTGAEASEQAVKSLHGPRLLHLATHGFFLEDNPQELLEGLSGARDEREARPRGNPLLRSGLAMAGANRSPGGDDDGILTALEMSGLDLSGTELAVLSACETGLGKVRNGEGVQGLRRALVLAGVKSQLTSLWRVDDAATAELMDHYYRRLARGATRSQALREAQLALLARPERRHPRFWSAFVPSGDFTAMPLPVAGIAPAP